MYEEEKREEMWFERSKRLGFVEATEKYKCGRSDLGTLGSSNADVNELELSSGSTEARWTSGD